MDSRYEVLCSTGQNYIHFYNIAKDSGLYVIQMGHHCTPMGYAFGPIVRDHYVIHFIKSGKGTFTFRNKKYELDAGKCFLIEPKQISYYQSDKDNPWEYYWIGFNGYQAESFVKQMGFTYDLPIRSIIHNREIFYEFDRMDAIGYDQDNFMAYHALMYYIVYYMIHSAAASFTELPCSYVNKYKISNEEYVEKVIDIIQSSFSGEILVNDIAQKLNLNRSYLSKIFKEHTEQSIKQYLTDYRLSKAAALLSTSNRPVMQIALEVGFPDPLYFSRIFQQKYKLPPSVYRQENR